MTTIEFFKELLKKRSVDALLKAHPSLTEREINEHFECVFSKCKNDFSADDCYELYTDGASKGNPGNAGIGAVIKKDGYPIEEISRYIGVATNNIAEYTALIEGLEKLKEMGIKKVKAFSDSELVVKQINGIYSIKNAELKKLHGRFKEIASYFDSFTIEHIPREQNKEADRLSKRAADGYST